MKGSFRTEPCCEIQADMAADLEEAWAGLRLDRKMEAGRSGPPEVDFLPCSMMKGIFGNMLPPETSPTI